MERYALFVVLVNALEVVEADLLQAEKSVQVDDHHVLLVDALVPFDALEDQVRAFQFSLRF